MRTLILNLYVTTKRDLATIKIKKLKYVGTLQIKIEYTST